jgi:hypothetical protein
MAAMNSETGVMASPVDRGAAESVEPQLVAAVERSEVRTHPFDHIVMEQVLDPAVYDALLSAMPDGRFYHQLRHVDAMRADGSSTRLRMYLYPELLWRLPSGQREAWVPIARALCSAALQDAFKRKFRAALEQRFGKPVERLGLYPVPILLRDQPGYRIGIHSDKPTKAITVQFYLPRDASQRHIGTIFHEGESGEAAERTTQMPFMPASGYAFPVTETKSWHSAARTSEGDGERVSMMVTYYVTDNPFLRLYWRARRALMSVGVYPRG